MKISFVKLIFLFGVFVLLAGCVKTNLVQEAQTGDDSLRKIKDKEKIVIGTYEQIPPVSFLDENGINTGHDVDVAKEIARELGVEAEFKNLFFPDLFAALKAEEIDIIVSAITITQERSKEMLFSVPYFDGGQSIVTRLDDTGIKSIEDLKGKKVGVLKGTTGEIFVDTLGLLDQDIVRMEAKEGRNQLETGQIDAWIEDYVGASGYVKSAPTVKIVGKPVNEEYYGVVTKIGNNSLIDEINRILRDMKRDGRLNNIKNKWL
jgi:ABC-type amino acid transport substrate-binding protein